MTQRSNTLAALSCSLKNHKTIHRIHPPATGPRHARAAVGTGERASARPQKIKLFITAFRFCSEPAAMSQFATANSIEVKDGATVVGVLGEDGQS